MKMYISPDRSIAGAIRRDKQLLEIKNYTEAILLGLNLIILEGNNESLQTIVKERVKARLSELTEKLLILLQQETLLEKSKAILKALQELLLQQPIEKFIFSFLQRWRGCVSAGGIVATSEQHGLSLLSAWISLANTLVAFDEKPKNTGFPRRPLTREEKDMGRYRSRPYQALVLSRVRESRNGAVYKSGVFW